MEYYSVLEIAERFGYTRQHIAKLCSDFGFKKVGRAYIIDESSKKELMNYFNNREQIQIRRFFR